MSEQVPNQREPGLGGGRRLVPEDSSSFEPMMGIRFDSAVEAVDRFFPVFLEADNAVAQVVRDPRAVVTDMGENHFGEIFVIDVDRPEIDRDLYQRGKLRFLRPRSSWHLQFLLWFTGNRSSNCDVVAVWEGRLGGDGGSVYVNLVDNHGSGGGADMNIFPGGFPRVSIYVAERYRWQRVAVELNEGADLDRLEELQAGNELVWTKAEVTDNLVTLGIEGRMGSYMGGSELVLPVVVGMRSLAEKFGEGGGR